MTRFHSCLFIDDAAVLANPPAYVPEITLPQLEGARAACIPCRLSWWPANDTQQP